MDIFSPIKQTGTFFNSPQPEQWAVRGQPSHQASVPLYGTEIHPASQHPNHNLTRKQHIWTNNSPKSVPGLPKTVPNFHHFSPKFRDLSNGHSWPHTIQTINKAPKPKINQVGENLYLPKLSKLYKTDTHA